MTIKFNDIKTVIISKLFYNKEDATNLIINYLNLNPNNFTETNDSYIFHQYDPFKYYEYLTICDFSLDGVCYIVPRNYSD